MAEYPDDAARRQQARRYFAAALRHKWLILALALVAGTAGFIVADYLPEEYVAQATVWIESGPGVDRAGPIRASELLRSSAWIELLRSFVVLDHVVRTERLYLETSSPAESTLLREFAVEERYVPGYFRLKVSDAGDVYRLVSRDGALIEQGRPGAAIGAQLGFEWQPSSDMLPPRLDISFRVSEPREVAIQLNRQLQTRMDQNANFLRLELRQPTAEGAARVLNGIADRYVEVAAELKRSRLDERTLILEEQLALAEANLREAERELQTFKVQTIVLPAERTAVAPGLQMTQDPVFRQYFDMRLELEQLRRDREAIERALEAGGDGVTLATALEAIPTVRGTTALTTALGELTRMQAELRALHYRYTAEHPPVRALQVSILELQEQTVPTLARVLMAELLSQEGNLQARIASAGGEIQQIPPRMIEEARLARHVAITEGLYRTLEERVQEARLSAASAIPDIRILDHAREPRTPTRNEKPKVIAFAILAGLGLGVLGAGLREHFDPSIRYPDQVAGLGIPLLGAVPMLATWNRQPTPEAIEQATEAFRGIRLNVSFAHGTGPIMTTISSPGAGDGKSFVATNLALSFADLGRRTLLIDGDIRRGRIHEVLQLDRVPGLTDYLSGEASLESVIRRTQYEALDVIPSGRRTRIGPELIDSPAMRRLILEARLRYEVILLDSAPLGAGVEPFVLGTLTGTMVLVFRSGETNHSLSEVKLGLLDRLPIRLLGAVMNGVKRNRTGYEYDKYYSYLPGYEARDEEESQRQLQGT
jgi:polysaccharide biosynthesis transport protein